MEYYIHDLFEQNGYGELPNCIEIVGEEGTGKSTALVQLAWECEVVGFGLGKPISAMFLSFSNDDPEPLTSLARFHLQERTYDIATTQPPPIGCKLSIWREALKPFFASFYSNWLFVDNVPDDDTLTVIRNTVGSEVKIAFVRDNGNWSGQFDTIVCHQIGYCSVINFDPAHCDGSWNGLMRLAHYDLFRDENFKDIDALHHSRREHNALMDAFLYGGIDNTHHKDWLIDQMVRKLTEQGYSKFVDNVERNGEPDGEVLYEWSTGIAP